MRIRALTLMTFLLAVIPAFAQMQQSAAQSPKPQVIAIRAGSLIDGTSDSPRANQVIIIRGNRIESVGDAASAKIPADARVIDLSHATVLPGLD